MFRVTALAKPLAKRVITMTEPASNPRDTLSVKVGQWFEAKGTGWGVVAIPVLTLVLALAAAARLFGW